MICMVSILFKDATVGPERYGVMAWVDEHLDRVRCRPLRGVIPYGRGVFAAETRSVRDAEEAVRDALAGCLVRPESIKVEEAGHGG